MSTPDKKNSTLDKYRKVPQEKQKSEENEIRVSAAGRVANYITYAATLFLEKKLQKCIIKGSGPAISKVCTVAEILRQRIKGLHEESKITSINIVDVYEPLEEGLSTVKLAKSLTVFEVILSLDEKLVNKSSPGYQEPLPEDQVKEFPINFGQYRQQRRGGRRGGFRGERRGRGQRRGGYGYRGGRKNFDQDDEDYSRDQRPKTSEDYGYNRQQRRGYRRGGAPRKYSGRNYERQEGQDRPERQRYDNRNDNRYDNRYDNRQDNRQENRQNNRYDNRQERRGQGRPRGNRRGGE